MIKMEKKKQYQYDKVVILFDLVDEADVLPALKEVAKKAKRSCSNMGGFIIKQWLREHGTAEGLMYKRGAE